LFLALTDDPHTTRAWHRGAVGEERLGARLEGLVSSTVRVLHDRRVPRSRANIDHIVVCPSGVFVVDAKRYAGRRPGKRVEGGILSPRRERLVVGGRDASSLVAGMERQVAVVSQALEGFREEPLPVRGVLCFVDADWPLFGGDFIVGAVQVLWPKRIAGLITQAR
jgi:hypothetical protein